MLHRFLNSCIIFTNKIRFRWLSHYSRVTGKPPSSGFAFTIYDSISKLDTTVWDRANTTGDIFLSSSYLTALEQAPPENMNFRYAIINKDDEIPGIAYFQILALNFRLHQSPLLKIRPVRANAFLSNIHNRIINTAGVHLLVCGNAMISGEHGFCFSSVPEEKALHVIAEIAHAIRKKANPPVTATLIKDFYSMHKTPTDVFSQFGFHLFDAGPNMTIPIRENWTNFDSYLQEMKPKYRKRVVSAIKKGSKIHRQSLSYDDIVRYRDELFTLYCQVVDKAKFKTYFLSPDYFISLKKYLGNNFDCAGYFLDSELIGFTTRIRNRDILEGYTHGLHYGKNKEFELYQNFLLDDIKSAIETQSSWVNTGRTSIAMKSSVGAIPKDMACYIRFSGGHSNQFVKPLFFFIRPSAEHCRNPFEE